LYGYGSPLRMTDINLEVKKFDSARRLKNSQRSTRLSMVSDNGLYCSELKSKYQNISLGQTLVRLLIEEIAPFGERIVGGSRTVVGGRPALGERFGGRLAMARRSAVNRDTSDTSVFPSAAFISFSG